VLRAWGTVVSYISEKERGHARSGEMLEKKRKILSTLLAKGEYSEGKNPLTGPKKRERRGQGGG